MLEQGGERRIKALLGDVLADSLDDLNTALGLGGHVVDSVVFELTVNEGEESSDLSLLFVVSPLLILLVLGVSTGLLDHHDGRGCDVAGSHNHGLGLGVAYSLFGSVRKGRDAKSDHPLGESCLASNYAVGDEVTSLGVVATLKSVYSLDMITVLVRVLAPEGCGDIAPRVPKERWIRKEQDKCHEKKNQ